MGAWGFNAFQNDDAADWLAELNSSDIVSFVEDALQSALPSPLALLQRQSGNDVEGYLEAPEACIALVAAEVVAAGRGNPHAALPDRLKKSFTPQVAAGLNELADLARMAVERIGAQSELRDLWEETEDFEAWLQDLQALDARLASA